MDENNVSTDHVIAELINMGFEFDQAGEATRAVGPCLEDAVEFILNGSCSGDTVHNERISSPFTCSTSQGHPLAQRGSSLRSSRRMKQSDISDVLSSSGKSKNSSHCSRSDSALNATKRYTSGRLFEQKVSNTNTKVKLEPISESSQQNTSGRLFEQKVSNTNTKVKPEPISESSQQNTSGRLFEQKVSNTNTKVKLEPISESYQQNTSGRLFEQKVSNTNTKVKLEPISESSQQNSHDHVHHVELDVPSHGIRTVQPREFSPFCSSRTEEINLDWEKKARGILQKHFGFSSLKSFQKEALEAWLANRDCLVLAATGSGKSLCFQIPALLTGKIVVVISPLISLMHDQCLKLARHGISACFLGSGQPDRTVECKAMSGMYRIIYVCPETVLRLMEPLKGLAESHGITLFAIDEVHCVSKWGHDFRPDYRRLSILRENFRACNLNFLKSDIPLMALTATATVPVREDIIKSLHMSKDPKIVLTSFFRPNLRFSLYQHQHYKQMSCPAMANLLSNTLYYKRFFPYYAFNVLGGLDNEGKGCVFTYDAVGSYERVGYSAQGSGSTLIMPVLDNQLKSPSPLLLPPRDAVTPLSESEAVDMVKDVFASATERDIYTGDKLEIVVINAAGIRREFIELRKD